MQKSLRKHMVCFGCALLVCVMLLGLLPTVTFAADGFSAAALTLQPGSDASQLNLNWYAETGTTSAQVRYKTGVQENQVIDATEKSAAKAAENGETVVCRATLTGLAPDTTYTYQVSNDNGSTWSREYTYTTPEANSFTFAFVGDPQLKNQNQDARSRGKKDGTAASDIAIAQGWADTLSALDARDVDFIASAGDQVDTTKTQSVTDANNTGSEWEYTKLFAPTQMQSLPFAAAVGNHDRHLNFLDHYNLPNVQDVSDTVNSVNTTAAVEATTAYGNYYYSYKNALFVVLNDSSYPASQEEAAPFIDAFRQTLTAATTAYADYDWLIVQHHKSTESVAQHVADRDIQYYVEAGFEKLMDEFHVDFVLAGHDHVYARSYAMYDGKRVSDDAEDLTDPAGTIYLTCNTGSGLKYYGIFSNSLYVKDNNAYPYLANGMTGSKEYLKGAYPLSTEVAVQNYIPGYTVVEVDGDTVDFTTYATYASDTTEADAVLDTFTVTKTDAAQAVINGVNNADDNLNAQLTACYDSGVVNKDGGSTEIVVYNSDNRCAYAVNGTTGHLIKLPLNVGMNAASVTGLTGIHIPVKEIVKAKYPDFAYGDMTSVAVSTQLNVIAVAIQDEDYQKNGKLVLLDYDGAFIAAYDTGVQPDMVTFTEDGLTAITANEGEPRMGTSGTDPKGSATILPLTAETLKTAIAKTVDFTAFDTQRAALAKSGVVLQKNIAPSVDLEPEYIAVSGNMAYISLQEANAIAVLDIEGQKFTAVYPLGFIDYSKTKIDINKDDNAYTPANYENLYGIRMPDGISTYTVGDKTYLLTANEGDARDWNDITNEVKEKTSPNGQITMGKKVTWFETSKYDGVDSAASYLFGGRSFSIYEVGGNGLNLVYDSGSDFEETTAEAFPAYFNCSNDNIDIEDRSGKKGPEPETVTVGTVEGNTYAFIALERIGGVMIYDVTDPANSTYANYINSRDFTYDVAGDVSPEGLAFVSASQSPTGQPLLLSACEVSGTIPVYSVSKRAGFSNYQLTFITNGGSAISALGRTPGTTIDLSEYVPVRKGYTFTGWYSDEELTTKVTSVKLTKNMKVYAGWDCTTPDIDAWINPFTDVSENDWFYEYVALVKMQSLMNGTSATTFSPYATITRGMIVTIIYRMENEPGVTGSCPFNDVKSNSYYEEAITWAAAHKIVEGYGNDKFGPDDPISREQMTAILYRYAQFKEYDVSIGEDTDILSYKDASDISEYAVPAMRWACGTGILNGDAGNLMPTKVALRCQAAAILVRFLNAVGE